MDKFFFRICLTPKNVIIIITASNHKYFYCLLFRSHYAKSGNKIKMRVLTIIYVFTTSIQTHGSEDHVFLIYLLIFSLLSSIDKGLQIFFNKQIYKIKIIIVMTPWLIFHQFPQYGFQLFMASLHSAWSMFMIYRFLNILKTTYIQIKEKCFTM